MERTVVVRAVKKVRMISNSNDPKDVSIEDVVVSMILVAVLIVVRVKKVAPLAKVAMESLKVVARKMSVTVDKIAMVLDDTSVAISVVVEVAVEEEEEEAAVEEAVTVAVAVE